MRDSSLVILEKVLGSLHLDILMVDERFNNNEIFLELSLLCTEALSLCKDIKTLNADGLPGGASFVWFILDTNMRRLSEIMKMIGA